MLDEAVGFTTQMPEAGSKRFWKVYACVWILKALTQVGSDTADINSPEQGWLSASSAPGSLP